MPSFSRFHSLMAAILVFAAPIPAFAEGPPLDYFTGTYMQTEGGDKAPFPQINDVVAIVSKGEGLVLSTCLSKQGSTPWPDIFLEFGTDKNRPKLLYGQSGPG